MRESIGSIALYNIIIIFIAVTFAILAGTMSYSKAFKANSRIINAIEKFEGYNEDSAAEIDLFLSSIGYKYDTTDTCIKKDGVVAIQKDPDEVDLNPNYNFCVYRFPETTKKWNGKYVTYGVKTFINIDLPIVGEFVKIPVYGRSKMIFNFNREYVSGYSPAPILLVSLTKEMKEKYGDNLYFYQGDVIEDIKSYFDVNIFFSTQNVSYILKEYNVDGLDTEKLGAHILRFSYGDTGLYSYFQYFVIKENSTIGG